MVKVGDKVPSVELDIGFPPEKVNVAEYSKGKKVILLGLRKFADSSDVMFDAGQYLALILQMMNFFYSILSQPGHLPLPDPGDKFQVTWKAKTHSRPLASTK